MSGRHRRLLRQHIEFLEGFGVNIDEIKSTGGSHIKVVATCQGNSRFFICSASPSDRRSFENWKSDVRKWVRGLEER